MKFELVYALQQKRYVGKIIPVLSKTCQADKLSWTLSSLEHIDFRRSFPAGFAELLRTLKRRA